MTAGEQRSLDVIPANTICTLQMTVRPGGAGDGGWLRRANNGGSEGLDCEFVVVDEPYAKRKVWQLFTLNGTTKGHADAGEISRNTLRRILKSPVGSAQMTPARPRRPHAKYRAGRISTTCASLPGSAYARRKTAMRRRTRSPK